MIQASRSASFSGRSSAADAGKVRPGLRGQKRHARLCPGASESYQPRLPIETRTAARGMEAFQEVVLASRPKFVSMAYAILRNREDAEDAVQNALLSGYLHLPSFEGRSALKTWLTRIVMNSVLMSLRKRKSAWMNFQLETNTSDEAGWIQEIPTSQPDPETIYAGIETIELVNGVLAKLKPVLRQAFTMTYCDEMSRAEARAFLGVSRAAFKSRILRARRELSNQVQRARVAPMRGATAFLPYKNGFEPLNAGQPGMGSEEGS